MIFPDLDLARRLERHEAWSSSEHARTQAQHYPATGAVTLSVAGGTAVYCGKQSPLSQVYGWGLSGTVSAADLDTIESFYGSRQLPTRIRVCPFAAPAALALLGARGYRVADFMNVFARRLDTFAADRPVVPGLRVTIATADEARLWFTRNDAGGDWTEPDGLTFMTIRSTLKADTQLYLAWLDGEPVSGGALELHDGVAALMAADTLPAFRKRGLHRALLHARLAAAAAAGCDLALVHTTPGAMSQNNALRAGFQQVYTAISMVSLAGS